MPRFPIAAALIAAAASAGAADIYTWTDGDGVVNFSTEKPLDATPRVFPAWKTPAAQPTQAPKPSAAAAAAPAGGEEERLRDRIERLESALDRSREQRVSEAERRGAAAEARLSEARREEDTQAFFAPWSTVLPPLLVVPASTGKGKGRHGRHDRAKSEPRGEPTPIRSSIGLQLAPNVIPPLGAPPVRGH